MTISHFRKKLALAIILVSMLYVTGCASIVTGQDQIVSVTTPNCPGAQCTLKNEEGTYYVYKTPGNASVDREYGDLSVTCSKPDYEPFSMNVASTTKGMAFGNILLGGVVGAAVDMGTGAAYDYPEEIVVPLDCRSDTEIAANSGNIGSHDIEAAKLVNLNYCKSPKFVLNDDGGEIYKSRCQDGSVGVIKCRGGQCVPLNVARKIGSDTQPNKPVMPKNTLAATQIARQHGCTESVIAADVASGNETWMAKCSTGNFLLIECKLNDCSLREQIYKNGKADNI